MDEQPPIFQQSAAVYDLLYEGKDSQAEADWVATTLQGHGCHLGSHLLEFGAGTGRHARLLADKGYHVTTIEPSSEMRKRAKSHSRVKSMCGDTSSTRLEEKFHAVLALFHVMSYHTTLHEIHAFFETASSHLDRGGLFAFDVWYSPAVHHLVPENRIVEKANETTSVTRFATPTEDISRSLVTVTYNYILRDSVSNKEMTFTEHHALRHFTQTEIDLLSQQHGFSLVESMEFMSGGKPSRRTWGVWFVLRKN
jgi:SAM-dependent methyltransferase